MFCTFIAPTCSTTPELNVLGAVAATALDPVVAAGTAPRVEGIGLATARLDPAVDDLTSPPSLEPSAAAPETEEAPLPTPDSGNASADKLGLLSLGAISVFPGEPLTAAAGGVTLGFAATVKSFVFRLAPVLPI